MFIKGAKDVGHIYISDSNLLIITGPSAGIVLNVEMFPQFYLWQWNILNSYTWPNDNIRIVDNIV